MKRLPLLLLSGLVVAAMAACGGKKPETTVAPAQPNADSLAEIERQRADSAARADREAKEREEAERDRQRRIADSLAAIGKSTEAVRTLLATMIHFDYDKALIRGGDAGVLDQKVAILQANPALRIRISSKCDELGSDECNRRGSEDQQYVVSKGIDGWPSQSVSYGAERPVASPYGAAVLAKNRRDEV